jgi:hypothetical protein
VSSQENNIVCLGCNQQTTEELLGSTIIQLGACPNCTSKNLRRIVQATFSGFFESLKGVNTTVMSSFDVIAYSQLLLNEAQNLIDSGQFDMAVVVLHTACEIVTEQALFKVITDKCFLSLGKYLSILLKGYQPNDGKVQKLLKRLTSKEI